MVLESVTDQDVAGGFATALGVVVYVIRKYFVPTAQDRSDDSKLGYVDELRADNEKLRDWIEKMAGERNDAVARLGAVEAELRFYKEQFERLGLVPALTGDSDGGRR